MPPYVAKIPNTTLAMIYEKNNPVFCSLSKPTLSKVKAENVVNPPQIPDIKKSFQLSFAANVLKARPQKSPIKKHPIIFTTKVPHGKE